MAWTHAYGRTGWLDPGIDARGCDVTCARCSPYHDPYHDPPPPLLAFPSAPNHRPVRRRARTCTICAGVVGLVSPRASAFRGSTHTRCWACRGRWGRRRHRSYPTRHLPLPVSLPPPCPVAPSHAACCTPRPATPDLADVTLTVGGCCGPKHGTTTKTAAPSPLPPMQSGRVRHLPYGPAHPGPTSMT